MMFLSFLACITQDSVLVGTIVEQSSGATVSAPHITIIDLKQMCKSFTSVQLLFADLTRVLQKTQRV